MPRTPFCATFRDLFTNRDYLLVALYVAAIDGTNDTFRTIVRSAFANYGVTSDMVRVTSVVAICLLPLLVLAGLFAARVKQVKKILQFCGIFATLLLGLMLIFIKLEFAWGLSLLVGFMVITNKVPIPLSLELLAELSFPVAEGFSSTAANLLLKAVTFALV